MIEAFDEWNLNGIFIIYKMFESEYSANNYKSLKVSIRAIIKNPEMLRFVLNHLKTKKMCKHTVKKLPFEICS